MSHRILTPDSLRAGRNPLRTLTGAALVLAAALLACLTCTTGPSDASGTDTGNARTAMLYSPDGSPAVGATVLVYTVGHSPNPALAKAAKLMDSTTTDLDGRYTLDSLRQGFYTIMGAGDGNLSFMDSVHMGAADDSIPPDTLGPPGTLRGVVRLRYAPADSQIAYVLVFGTNTFTQTDPNTGEFALANMAAATYKVRILATVKDYAAKDTALTVFSAKDTTLLDTVWLTYTGIPVPQGLRLSYDTLRQIITLTWRPADTALVRGYNVYRQHADSGVVKLNAAVIADTVYRDSTALEDNDYTYQVKAVDSTGNEGLLSGRVVVLVASAFTLVKTIDVGSVTGNLAKAIAGSTSEPLHILSRAPRPGVFLLDSNGILIDSFGVHLLQNPYDMAQDGAGNTYVTDILRKQIVKFDASGGMVADWSTNYPGSVIVLDDSVLFVGTNVDVEVFDLDGNPVRQFPYVESTLKGLAVGSDGFLFIYGDKTITKYTRDGTLVASIYDTDLSHLQSYNDNGYMVCAGSGTLAFVLNRALYVISEEGELLSELNNIGNPLRMHLSPDRRYFWLPDMQGLVKVYRRDL